MNIVTHPAQQPMRILAVSTLWQGADDFALIRAFQRAGHSVRTVSVGEYRPNWQLASSRMLRRLLRGQIAREFNAAVLAEAEQLRPDLFFVFNGELVFAETLRALGARGIICIQFHPDTALGAQSPYAPAAIAEYDWIFSTKPDHKDLLRSGFGMDRVSFLPHAFDPETHTPPRMSQVDWQRYGCDLSLIGNFSPSRCRQMMELCEKLGDRRIRIWGASNWLANEPPIDSVFQGASVYGAEYAKAIHASRINLGLLFEGHADGTNPDRITSRTFHIPASGGFMLHERTIEAKLLFEEGKECAFFSDTDELVDKARYYLEHDDERRAIAAAGRQRCLNSGYSTDSRIHTIIAKYAELHGAIHPTVSWL